MKHRKDGRSPDGEAPMEPMGSDQGLPGAPSGAPSTGEGEDSRPSTSASLDDALLSGEPRTVEIEAALRDQRDKYLRLAAEYDNFRKRATRERQEAELRGMGQLIRGIVDAIDDLGRFAHVDPTTVDSPTIVHGVELVEKKLLKSLAGHGLEVVNPTDRPFDPSLHEAVAAIPTDTPDDDHFVAQVYQVGYVFNGQLLRPARVVVKQWKDPPAD